MNPKEYQKDYYQSHRDQKLKYRREKYSREKEEIKRKRREYYWANHEKVLESQKRTYQKYYARPRKVIPKEVWLEKERKRLAIYREQNRNTLREKFRSRHTRMRENQAGRPKPELCELCGGNGRICFDHEHTTGKFRGWLCHRCNVVLGLVNDNKDLLNRLAMYLNRFNK